MRVFLVLVTSVQPFTPLSGLSVKHTMTWQVGSTRNQSAAPGMGSTQGLLIRGRGGENLSGKISYDFYLSINFLNVI